MQGLRLCSRQAETPYYIEDMDLNIYSIEELAYYLYNTVYFVDNSFFNEKLAEYIQQELRFPKLAAKLKYSMGQKSAFADLILLVVREAQYYDEDEIKRLQKNLDIIGTKSLKERMKLRAEMLYQGGKLTGANEAFVNILNEKEHSAIMTGNKENDEFYAGIYLGIGKIKVRMFYFTEAVEDLKKAYILYPNKEFAGVLINAMLLNQDYQTNSKEELLQDILTELGTLTVEESLITECIKEIKALALRCELTPEFEHLEKIVTYDGCRNLDDFYDGIRTVVDEWKQEYRKQI